MYSRALPLFLALVWTTSFVMGVATPSPSSQPSSQPSTQPSSKPSIADSGILGPTAANGIMAGTAVTCVNNGLIDADVIIHPGSSTSGFPPCVISGIQELGTGVAEQAQVDLATAYNTLAGLPCPPANAIMANLGGTTLEAGVYCTAGGIAVTGTLTLDGGGDPDSEFVFQAGTSLTTAGNIVLINGAQADNVYWQVGSSATLGTASQWQGNIVALTSITLVGAANLLGRALARNGAVTLGTGNTITLPSLSAAPTAPPTAQPTTSCDLLLAVPMEQSPFFTSTVLPKARSYSYAVSFGDPIYQYRPNGTQGPSIGTVTPEDCVGNNQFMIANGDGPCTKAGGKYRDGTLTIQCAETTSIVVDELSVCVYDVLWSGPAFC